MQEEQRTYLKIFNSTLQYTYSFQLGLARLGHSLYAAPQQQ